jgi:hypothetical protein
MNARQSSAAVRDRGRLEPPFRKDEGALEPVLVEIVDAAIAIPGRRADERTRGAPGPVAAGCSEVTPRVTEALRPRTDAQSLNSR